MFSKDFCLLALINAFYQYPVLASVSSFDSSDKMLQKVTIIISGSNFRLIGYSEPEFQVLLQTVKDLILGVKYSLTQAIWLINEPGIVQSAVNRFHISRLVPETVFESIKT